MSIEQCAAEVTVQIRTASRFWIQQIVTGGLWLVLALLWRPERPLFALYWLALGCLSIAQGLWQRTLGIDLTSCSANLRGFRRRSIPWQQVQAVVHHRRLGTWGVRLIRQSGKPVMLRVPVSTWGFGSAAYERDFSRIGAWWLAHRGESWRPVAPEAPALVIPSEPAMDSARIDPARGV
jgi:hypothetical protein